MTSALQQALLPASSHILVADPEARTRDALAACLRGSGFTAVGAASTAACWPLLLRQPVRLLLLGSGLARDDALGFLAGLRGANATRQLPVIVIAAAASEDFCVATLETGADGFMARPFGMAELGARVRAVLRRTPERRAGRRFEYDGLVLDREAGRLLARSRPVPLRPRELQLLQFLLCYPERLHARETLRQLLSGGERGVDSRSVDAQICRLRGALAPFGYAGHVQTVHGKGYRLSRTAVARRHVTGL